MSNLNEWNINILYEDDNCLIIDKPSGIMVHSDGRAKGPFLTDWILNHYPQTKDVGESISGPNGEIIYRPGIVHRLDRETSGVLIIAKKQEFHTHMKRQFQERLVSKKYIAIVWGLLKEDFGNITRPIGRSKNDFRKYSAQRGVRGELREAETYWTKLGDGVANIDSNQDDKKERFSVIEAEPKTGRTHQIRVHFLAINHPVVCDSLYAPNKPMVLGLKRTALHSKFVSFEDLSGKRIEIQAKIPEDMIHALEQLGIESLAII